MQAFDLGRQAGIPSLQNNTSSDLRQISHDLGRDAVASFATVVDEMSRIREFHGEICGNLDQFAELVANGGGDLSQLDTLETDVQRLLSALKTFAELTVSPKARSHAREAGRELEVIDKSGHVLSAIASLMGTTIASLGLKNLDTFLAELKQTADSIQDSSETVTGHINRFASRGAVLLKSCNSATSVLSDLIGKLSEPRATLDQLSSDEAQASLAVANRAKELTRDGRSHLNSFVTAMQFSDRLAQRLEHLSEMLANVDGHVSRLAAAQARRCAADIDSVSADVRATMVQLADLGRAGSQVFSGGRLAETISSALSTRAEVVDMVIREIASVQQVVDVARSEAAQAAELAGLTNQSFDGLKDASKNLALASYNSMLVSNRYSHASGPMKVLSREVRQIASDCLAAVDVAQGEIAQITGGSGQAQAELISATQLIEQRLADFKTQTKGGEERLSRINDMRSNSATSAESLLHMVDAITDSMSRVDQVSARLSELATSLDAIAENAGPMDCDRINAIWDS